MDKHYGFYRGKVTNNIDPENFLRVKLLVPQILGTEETEWAWPCVPVNWSKGLVKQFINEGGHAQYTGTGLHTHSTPQVIDIVPKIGTGVWVTFEGGDTNHPIWMGVWA